MASTTEPTTRAPIERTEHPHIVKSADTNGGEPRIEETRMAVRHVIDWPESGMSPRQIVATWPYLTLAQIHDALGDAYDHPNGMEASAERNKLRTAMKEQDIVDVGGRLIDRDLL